MALTVSVQEAKRHLSRLVKLVRTGEEVIIAESGTPIARLTGIPARRGRVLGAARGQIILTDDFDDPLPPGMLDAFER